MFIFFFFFFLNKKKLCAGIPCLFPLDAQHGLLASGGGTADRTIRFSNVLTAQMFQSINTGSQVSRSAGASIACRGLKQSQKLFTCSAALHCQSCLPSVAACRWNIFFALWKRFFHSVLCPQIFVRHCADEFASISGVQFSMVQNVKQTGTLLSHLTSFSKKKVLLLLFTFFFPISHTLAGQYCGCVDFECLSLFFSFFLHLCVCVPVVSSLSVCITVYLLLQSNLFSLGLCVTVLCCRCACFNPKLQKKISLGVVPADNSLCFSPSGQHAWIFTESHSHLEVPSHDGDGLPARPFHACSLSG